MKKTVFVALILFATIVSSSERGGESPQAAAKRFQNAYAIRDVGEILACVAERERSTILSFNLITAAEISTVLEGIDERAINSSTFTADNLPQDTKKRREFVRLVKRNGIKLGGPPTTAQKIDPVKHFMSIAGPNPDRTIAELDAYNRRYLGASNPTDQLLRIFPKPEFSNFQISKDQGTARMGETTVTFENQGGRWFLSNFFVIGFEAENAE